MHCIIAAYRRKQENFFYDTFFGKSIQNRFIFRKDIFVFCALSSVKQNRRFKNPTKRSCPPFDFLTAISAKNKSPRTQKPVSMFVVYFFTSSYSGYCYGILKCCVKIEWYQKREQVCRFFGLFAKRFQRISLILR